MVTTAGGFSPAGLNRSGRIAPGSWVLRQSGKQQVAPLGHGRCPLDDLYAVGRAWVCKDLVRAVVAGIEAFIP